MRESLIKSRGMARAERMLALIAQKGEHTASAGTAYQSYWTGAVEVTARSASSRLCRSPLRIVYAQCIPGSVI